MTQWIIALQASLFLEFSRQEYWSGLPFPFPGDLPNPGIEHGSPALQADFLPSEPPGKHSNHGAISAGLQASEVSSPEVVSEASQIL